MSHGFAQLSFHGNGHHDHAPPQNQGGRQRLTLADVVKPGEFGER
jgi:hypothetical protein